MYKGFKVLAVVPARGGSKGVKLKNIKPLLGIPLVGHVGKTLEHLDYIDRVVCSTDHKGIAEVAEEYGMAVPFYRSEELSGDRVSDWQVLNEVLTNIEALDEVQYDIILMLQPTSPFRKPEDITGCLDMLIDGGHDAVWTVSETDSKGHPLKQFTVSDDDGALEFYDEEGKKIIARQQLTPVYHRNGIAYAFTRDCLFSQKTIYGEKTAAYIIYRINVNIDTELDYKLAEFFFANQ